MGKATIIGGGAQGKYLVKIEHDTRRMGKEIADLQEEDAAIEEKLGINQADITDAEATLDSLKTDLDFAIKELAEQLVGDETELKGKVESLTTKVKDQVKSLETLFRIKQILVLRRAAIAARIGFLSERIPPEDHVEAWCADFNENLSGDVGTIEFGRVAGQPIIQPGGEFGSQSEYAQGQDGQLQPIFSGTAASAFYNYAMLPGFERWKPRYRSGNIVSLNGDLCNVLLDHTTSTHQKINTTPGPALSNVPIFYMDCNGSAFSVGDHVIVEFQNMDPTQPVVVGFVQEPRPCQMRGIAFNSGGKTSIIKYENAQWTITQPNTVLRGTIDWRGPGDLVVSWMWGSRYFECNHQYSTAIYRSGKKLLNAPGPVMGAAIHGDKLIFICGRLEFVGPSGSPVGLANTRDSVYIADLNNLHNPRLVYQREWNPSNIRNFNCTSWLFNESATEAVAPRGDILGESQNLEYRKMIVDWENEGISIEYLDHRWYQETTYGLVQHNRQNYPDTSIRISEHGKSLNNRLFRLKFYDFIGDSLAVGEIEYVYESSTEGFFSANYDPGDEETNSTYEITNFENDFVEYEKIKLTMGGFVAYEDEYQKSSRNDKEYDNGKTSYGGVKLRDATITRGLMRNKETIIKEVDLRSGACKIDIYEEKKSAFSQQCTTQAEQVYLPGAFVYYVLYRSYILGDAQPSSFISTVDWLWNMFFLSVNALDGGQISESTENVSFPIGRSGWVRDTGGPRPPISPVSTQSSHDFFSGTSGWFIEIGYGSPIPLWIMTRAYNLHALYPGDHTRGLLSTPIGRDARGDDAWIAAGSPYLTVLIDGNFEQLTGDTFATEIAAV